MCVHYYSLCLLCDGFHAPLPPPLPCTHTHTYPHVFPFVCIHVSLPPPPFLYTHIHPLQAPYHLPNLDAIPEERGQAFFLANRKTDHTQPQHTTHTAHPITDHPPPPSKKASTRFTTHKQNPIGRHPARHNPLSRPDSQPSHGWRLAVCLGRCFCSSRKNLSPLSLPPFFSSRFFLMLREQVS